MHYIVSQHFRVLRHSRWSQRSCTPRSTSLADCLWCVRMKPAGGFFFFFRVSSHFASSLGVPFKMWSLVAGDASDARPQQAVPSFAPIPSSCVGVN